MVSDMEAGRAAIAELGLPVILRPGFTLGGEGGGAAHTPEEFEPMLEQALAASPIDQVLIDRSLVGWAEIELEVVRDVADNAVIVCSIENIDPMGVHTGDSVTVAPVMTLTDPELQRLRDAAIAVIRAVGVSTGGANVQFALDRATRRDGRHRDEPARVALLGARVQGDRLPDRQDRRRAWRSATRSTSCPTRSPASRRPASSRRSTTSRSRSRASPSRRCRARPPS